MLPTLSEADIKNIGDRYFGESHKVFQIVGHRYYDWLSYLVTGDLRLRFFTRTPGTTLNGWADTNMEIAGCLPPDHVFLLAGYWFDVRGENLGVIPIGQLCEVFNYATFSVFIDGKRYDRIQKAFLEPRYVNPPLMIGGPVWADLEWSAARAVAASFQLGCKFDGWLFQPIP